MTDISTGGIRDRLIRDAVATTVRQALTDLGWFGPGRAHLPLLWRDNPVTEIDVEVPLNTLAVFVDDMNADEIELGSMYSEERHDCWADFYTENADLGKHVIGDVRDILRGKHPSIGRTAPVIPVYDVTQDPVPAEPAFILEVDRVEAERVGGRDTSRPFEQFWFVCSFQVVDTR